MVMGHGRKQYGAGVPLIYVLNSMREPPWLLTASTSTRDEGARDQKLGTFVRQEAPGSGPVRPILGAVPGMSGGAPAPDRIARGLRRAMGVWRTRHDPTALRLAIERLLAMPEMAESGMRT
jgi:hypothetical protein